MSRRAVWFLAGALSLGSACAPIPKPDVLARVEGVRRGPSATDAAKLAPGAYAHAEKLRREANAAFDEDDYGGAQILGERAIAAYAHAHALARIARAEQAGHAARAELGALEKELATLEGDQARIGAESDALELRVRVARDAQPIVPSGPADAAREASRLAAARSLAIQARMLCGAARLLIDNAPTGPDAQPAPPAPAQPPPAPAKPADPAAPHATPPAPGGAELATATAELEALDAQLDAKGVAPLDRATRARAACLAVLTSVRRGLTPVGRAPGAGDALLAELSASGGFAPARDDRGIVVTLRDVFDKDGLSRDGEAKVRELGRVAAAHPTFPVAIVVHQDKQPSSAERARWAARAEAAAKALGKPGAATVQAGVAAPVVDPAGKQRARNARVEIVFVTPDTF